MIAWDLCAIVTLVSAARFIRLGMPGRARREPTLSIAS
jgi:hypothetical protein